MVSVTAKKVVLKRGVFRLSKIDFSLKPGAVMGLVGRSGSGKSTLIESLIGTLKPLQGIITIPKDAAEFENTDEKKNAEDIAKGLNLISLQTLFPTILFLIVIFISLLVSCFVTLQEINSTAAPRLNMIKGLFMPQILSNYLTSMIIISFPVFIVVILGHFLFKLPILDHTISSFTILFLMSSTFVLILLMFYSGFLLPVERMSSFASTVSLSMPGKLAVGSFAKVVFYRLPFSSIQYACFVLFGGVIAMFTCVVGIRLFMNSKP
jgi:energy-coupling factor transporter ATP-binding protein EcfA2